MPHVRRRLLLPLDAPADRAREVLVDSLGLSSEDGAAPLSGPLPHDTTGQGTLTAAVEPAPDGHSTVTLEAHSTLKVPFFQWFFGPVVRVNLRRLVRHAGDTVESALRGDAPPPAPGTPTFLPAVPFDHDQIRLLAAVCALGAVASFGSALFGQVGDPIRTSFHASKADLGGSLAITRAGVLVALVVGVAADRRGRRRLLAISFAGLCGANAIAAIAPNLAIFTGSQLLTRAFVNAIVVVAGIAAIEDAPDGARAFAAMMLGLSAGFGYGVSVVLLPLADLGSEAWRILFAVSGASIVLLPAVMRAMPETRRWQKLTARGGRGRVSELGGHSYGPRFIVLAVLAFLTSVFSAPSAQLTNTFLHDERGFSNSAVALFRTVTNGVPGLLGLVIGGRLAESRGRRPVAVVGVAAVATIQVVFFLSSGVVLWLASTFAIVFAGASTLAIGTMDAEMFPTEVRGTSNSLLLVCGVAGSVTGLLLAGFLSGPLGGLGPSIALCGIAPMIGALFFAPRLPESAHRDLDDVSPSEV
jgi:predicted MFS family arabinose efflux permease